MARLLANNTFGCSFLVEEQGKWGDDRLAQISGICDLQYHYRNAPISISFSPHNIYTVTAWLQRNDGGRPAITGDAEGTGFRSYDLNHVVRSTPIAGSILTSRNVLAERHHIRTSRVRNPEGAAGLATYRMYWPD
nr:hypothetical protein CFP56_03938 [Quercus suber]